MKVRVQSVSLSSFASLVSLFAALSVLVSPKIEMMDANVTTFHQAQAPVKSFTSLRSTIHPMLSSTIKVLLQHSLQDMVDSQACPLTKVVSNNPCKGMAAVNNKCKKDMV